jgi:hypothetical protein
LELKKGVSYGVQMKPTVFWLGEEHKIERIVDCRNMTVLCRKDIRHSVQLRYQVPTWLIWQPWDKLLSFNPMFV